MALAVLARYRTLLAEQPTFRRFWTGFAAAVTADEIVRIAFVWFVYAHTGSAAAVGWLMVCFTALILAGGFLAGWVLDRFDRRLAMVLDNLVRAAAIALVPLLNGLGVLALWHLYVIAGLFGLLMMIPLGEALRHVIGNAFLVSTTLMFLLFNIGLGLLLVWLPVFADMRLASGAAGYGLLLAAFATGQMAAALAVGGVAPGGRLGLRICMVQALAGLAVVAIWPVQQALAAAAILFLFGTMVAPLTVWAQTLRMGIVPPSMHGRTFALLRTLMQAGRPIGGAMAGLVIDPTALGLAILLSAALIGMPGLVGFAVRDLRAARPPL